VLEGVGRGAAAYVEALRYEAIDPAVAALLARDAGREEPMTSTARESWNVGSSVNSYLQLGSPNNLGFGKRKVLGAEL
jgi:hypothetical protein